MSGQKRESGSFRIIGLEPLERLICARQWSKADLVVYLALLREASYSRRTARAAIMSESELSTITGLQKSQVHNALEKLEDRGLLRWRRGVNRHASSEFEIVESSSGLACVGRGHATSVRRNAVKSASQEPDERFEAFWAEYPCRITATGRRTKGDKQAARKAWDKACKKADPAEIVEAVKRYPFEVLKSGELVVPDASRWLNEERWKSIEDEPEDDMWWLRLPILGTGDEE